jgi:hypothetical protein
VGTSREVVFNRSNGDYVAAEMSVSTAIIGSDNERYYMAFLKGVTEESHRKKILALQENVFKKISGDDPSRILLRCSVLKWRRLFQIVLRHFCR